MDPVRVGLLGAGAVAQVAHLPAYRRLRNARLLAICDSEPAKRRALRERTGVKYAVASLDELLAIDEIDAVDVCLPSHQHRDAVIRCLEAGKHVLCEKPLAITPEDVDDIVAARERTGRILLVGMNNRYRDDVILLKKFVEDGTLGGIVYARAGWFKRRDRIRPEEWHYRTDLSGGGVFMDLGIQILDLSLWLSGYPEPERATAAFHHHLTEIEVEDSAVVSLSCAGGVTIALESSWRFVSDTEHISLGLFGTDGSALLNPIRIFQQQHGNVLNVTPQAQRRAGNLYKESYEREIAFFAQIVAGREEAPPLAEQRALARAVAAIQRSASEGREVAVALVEGPAAG
ncbi:MAG: Gfo/Idh/MocA family oxidoreductase [Gemmatimonadetes bacterium]|nr:Gfo/Idh/MocA family oxidoreductase [Gemmatimonadota bacterium]